MNVALWGRALYTVQRVDKAAWTRLDIVSRWLIASRASVLVITFISVSIAGLMAIRAGRFDATLWVLASLALLFAHATNNLIADAAVSGVAALAIGGYLVAVRGPLALALMAAGAFFVLFYTYPLKYIGLGELAVILVWGPLMIGGTYFVVTGLWDWDVALVGLPYALGATTVIFGKHIDKLEDDRARGIHTLPVIIGERAARWILGAMIVLMYATVAYLVLIGFLTPVVLIV